MTPIGYDSSEHGDEMKLADYECKIFPSQRFTEQTQEQDFIDFLSPLFNNKQSLTSLSLL